MKRQKAIANTIQAIKDRGIIGDDATKDVMHTDIGRNTSVFKDENGLTEKMEIFAQSVSKGSTLSAAYRTAYDCSNSKDATVYAQASRMLDHPAVAARVKDLMEQRRDRTFALDVMRTRQHVFDRLMLESEDMDNQARDRLKALEMLGSIDVVSMFKPQAGASKPDERKPEDIEQQLKQALQSVFSLKPKA